MLSLFAAAADDQSIYYLGTIFGPVGSVLPGGGGTALLGTMFKTFNTAVLALGSILVTYTTAMGIMLTAHEGKFLGKMHQLWVPLRTVGGIAALAPTSTGYSSIQILMMWIIMQGIGAADALWSNVITYIESGGAVQPLSPAQMQSLNGSITPEVRTLFTGLVCQAAAKANYSSSYYCGNNPTDLFCTTSDSDMWNINPSASTYSMGPGGSCGALTLGTGAQGPAQNQAYQYIIPTLGAIAAQLVSVDYTYTQFWNTPAGATVTPPTWLTQFCSDQNIAACTPASLNAWPPPKPGTSPPTVAAIYWPYALSSLAGGNFILNAANLYFGIVSTAMLGSPSSSNAASTTSVGGILNAAVGGGENVTQILNTASANGWIFAGGYFYTIAAFNNQVQTAVTGISVTPLPTSSVVMASQYITSTLVSEATSLENEISNEQNQGSATLLSGGGCSIGGGVPGISDLCNQLIQGWMEVLSGGGTGSSISNLAQNPVVAAQAFGEGLLIAIEVFLGVLLPTLILMSAVSGAMSSISPGQAMWDTFEFVVLPIVFFCIGILFTLAATLAIYTPLIPYMVFTFGAIGWFIATIETMVAAPLVALGILYPEGHDMWGAADKAFMLIFNIFLRPSLMVFGMMAGLTLSYVVISFINAMFLGVVQQINPLPGPVEVVLFMCVYTSLFITSLNKCFELIHVIPDQVLRWIGGQGAQFGESESLGKMKGSFEGAASKGASTAEGAGKGMTKPTQDKRKAAGESKAQDAQAQATAAALKKALKGD